MGEHQPSELLWSATAEELKRGYRLEAETGVYRCLACGSESEQGVIYPAGEGRDGLYLDAEKWMKEHVVSAHRSMMHYLTGLDKKWTGLSDLQRSLLLLFHEGVSDGEIVKRKLGGGSASTIRNHRFMLREKEKQARLFLAMMELLKESKGAAASKTGSAASSAGGREDDGLPEGLGKLFPDGAFGPLRRWPGKESLRIRIAGLLSQRFEPRKRYTEKEVSEVLEQAWPDYAVLRRYMIEYGFMEREDDGSAYWLTEEKESPAAGENQAAGESLAAGAVPGREKRKELLLAYEESERPAGVYRIVNRSTGRMLVGSSPNLGGAKNRSWFQLENGGHPNTALQEEFRSAGGEGFAFEVLEECPVQELASREAGEALARLEAKWLEELQPYGERGYHPAPGEGGARR
ncbi:MULTISPECIES: DUF2087 domain-containing protein [Paenibacillus]|uniref:DUF2087 domain-containing protein n=1 Tax=Paenibacillus TaxID=44249 RepID=UPI0022B8DF69|nr:DUF2087 domain-containing protein [Paenibacillus caseinilyticus]MCZ8520743.1 DUF2087 domain-containing protein [Paenibacillus caseinilyticus]